MQLPKFIAVSGMIASGKSTIAKQLSKNLNYQYVPESRISIGYLDDLFQNPSRWAFEAQVSFLAEKANEATKLIQSNIPLIMDRTLEEDAFIFAKYFKDKRFIDERSYATYIRIYGNYKELLGFPTVVLHSVCSKQTCLNRIQTRENFCKKYPTKYIDDIFAAYQEPDHLSNYKYSLVIDSDKHDYRNPWIVDKLITELKEHLFVKQKNVPNGSTIFSPYHQFC